MSPSIRGLQLTSSGAGGKTSRAGGEFSGDLEDVRLLDSYESDDVSHDDETKRIQVRVSGMTCAACSNSVETALGSLNGVVSASVALLQNRADVVFNPNLVKVSLRFL